jgi:hypothetical protein
LHEDGEGTQSLSGGIASYKGYTAEVILEAELTTLLKSLRCHPSVLPGLSQKIGGGHCRKAVQDIQ